MSLFDFLTTSKEFNVYQHDIHIFMNMIIWPLMTYTVTSFGKALAHMRNCLLKKAHVINKNIDGNDTDGFSKIWVKIKKDAKPTYSIFQPVSIIYISFFGWIVFWQNCIVVFFIFFFQEKTLGDISFKLDTNIMNFMSGFFSKTI